MQFFEISILGRRHAVRPPPATCWWNRFLAADVEDSTKPIADVLLSFGVLLIFGPLTLSVRWLLIGFCRLSHKALVWLFCHWLFFIQAIHRWISFFFAASSRKNRWHACYHGTSTKMNSGPACIQEFTQGRRGDVCGFLITQYLFLVSYHV